MNNLPIRLARNSRTYLKQINAAFAELIQWLTDINLFDEPGAGEYYGTNEAGEQGFHELPAPLIGTAVIGSVQIDDPETSIDVTHGLPHSPGRGQVQVTPRDTTDGWLDGASSTKYAVRDFTETQFTIALDSAPGADKHVAFDWYAASMDFVIISLSGSGDWAVPEGVTELTDVLLVAGGGGGGSRQAGGGGAGGVLHLTDVSVTPEALIAYSVGAGGAGGTSGGRGTDGSNTTFGAETAVGGGAGGGRSSGSTGNSGGSGGGGADGTGAASGTAGTGGDGTAGQGHDGGDPNPQLGNSAGGGGGAGEVGGDALSTPTQTNNVAGAGGNGVDMSAIFGTEHGETGWLGGGGGGSQFGNETVGPAPGGKGGGGEGADTEQVGGTVGGAGQAGTGGGGGGSANTASSGGSGGSGVILIRYAVNR